MGKKLRDLPKYLPLSLSMVASGARIVSMKVSEARIRGVAIGTRLDPPLIQGMVFPIVLQARTMGVAHDFRLGQALRLHQDCQGSREEHPGLERDHRQAAPDNGLFSSHADHISSPYLDFSGSTLHD